MRSRSAARSHNTSFESTRRRSYLPRISETKNPGDISMLYDNPFYVPPDEEMLDYAEKEKEARNSIRRQNRELKVWKKDPGPSTRQKLRQFLNKSCMDDHNESDTSMNIYEAANNVIKRRVRPRESVKGFLAKKREMFLFQLSINEKKEQVKEYEELAHLQEVSLQQSMHMLEKDAATFQKYVEENKNLTINTIKRSEDQTKEKQRYIREIKRLEDKLSGVMSKNIKQLEKLEKMYGYKIFLDNLTPEDFKSGDDSSNRQVRKLSSMASDSAFSEYSDTKLNIDWGSYGIKPSPELTDYLGQEDIQFKMYFKDPEQLQMIFGNLEEKNLFVMKYIQEVEQNIENLRQSFSQKKANLIEKEKQLRKNKLELEKTLQQKIQSIAQLNKRKEDSKLVDPHEKIARKLDNAIKQLYLNRKVFGESKTEHEKNWFEGLYEVEKKVECYLQDLNMFKPQKVVDIYRACGLRRREEVKTSISYNLNLKKANMLKKLREENEKKLKFDANWRRLGANKRTGRPVMAKSFLKTEEKQEEVKDEIDPEEVEKQRYFSVRFN